MDAASPGRTFEALWTELQTIAPRGAKIGKYYGKAFVVSGISEGSITIESPDTNGQVERSLEVLRAIYAAWRSYRYERLSHKNTQEILHAVSLIDYVVQTWVRREERLKVIESSRTVALRDGVFRVVHYNKHGRHLGPRPSGEPLSLGEVFPTQQASLLLEIELSAIRLFNAAGTSAEKLSTEYPGFGPKTYSSVAMRNQRDEAM